MNLQRAYKHFTVYLLFKTKIKQQHTTTLQQLKPLIEKTRRRNICRKIYKIKEYFVVYFSQEYQEINRIY